MTNRLEAIFVIPIMLAAAHLEMMVGKCSKPWFDCGLTGLVMRYGAPPVFGKVAEPIEVYHAIAKAAGKEPRDRG